jgi:hypothetical protein
MAESPGKDVWLSIQRTAHMRASGIGSQSGRRRRNSAPAHTMVQIAGKSVYNSRAPSFSLLPMYDEPSDLPACRRALASLTAPSSAISVVIASHIWPRALTSTAR